MLNKVLNGFNRSLITALVAAGFISTPSCAAGWSPDELNGNWGSFLAGFAGGVAVHKLGQVVVAKNIGYGVKRNGVSKSRGCAGSYSRTCNSDKMDWHHGHLSALSRSLLLRCCHNKPS